MDNNDTRTITLRINGKDAQKKLDELNKKLEDTKANLEKQASYGTLLKNDLEEQKKKQAEINRELSKGNISRSERKRLSEQQREVAKKISEIEKEHRANQDQINKTLKEQTRTQNQIERIEHRRAALNRTMQNLGKANAKEVREYVKQLKAALDSGDIERGSKAWEEHIQLLKEATAELQKLEKERKFEPAKEEPGLLERARKWGERWVGLIGAFNMGGELLDNFVGFFRGLATDAADMAEHLSGVEKYTGRDK